MTQLDSQRIFFRKISLKNNHPKFSSTISKSFKQFGGAAVLSCPHTNMSKAVLLPAAVVPSHYNITIDLDLENFVFSGVVEISVHVVGGKSFQLHSLDLEYGEGAAALHYEEGGVSEF